MSGNSPFLSASSERNCGSCLFANFQHCPDLEPSGLLPEVHTAVDLSILKHTDHTPLHLTAASHIPASHHFIQPGFLSNSTPFSLAQSLSPDSGGPSTATDIPLCSRWLRSPSSACHSGYCLSFTFVFLPRLLPQHLKLLKILPGQLYRTTVFGLQNRPVLRATLPW